jgi:hypothetical protein
MAGVASAPVITTAAAAKVLRIIGFSIERKTAQVACRTMRMRALVARCAARLRRARQKKFPALS